MKKIVLTLLLAIPLSTLPFVDTTIEHLVKVQQKALSSTSMIELLNALQLALDEMQGIKDEIFHLSETTREATESIINLFGEINDVSMRIHNLIGGDRMKVQHTTKDFKTKLHASIDKTINRIEKTIALTQTRGPAVTFTDINNALETIIEEMVFIRDELYILRETTQNAIDSIQATSLSVANLTEQIMALIGE